MNTTATAEKAETASYISDYDAITKVLDAYNQGVTLGKSEAMKAAFHPNATFFGYYKGNLYAGPCQSLFDWVDSNGPVAGMRVRQASVGIFETIAVVRLEMENVTGKLADPSGSTLSDLFQLIKMDGEWKISQKSFHWHS